jgi:hypothetical protein
VLSAAAIVAATGCSGSSGPATGGARTPPDLAAFLRLPVATPSACPPSANGETSGRRSPWVGHVDVSVFLARGASKAQVGALRARLQGLTEVRKVYFESRDQAHEEFRRLYTCSNEVPRSAAPASFRLVLHDVTRPQRDDLVRSVIDLAGVASVACDPSSPCVDVTRATR